MKFWIEFPGAWQSLKTWVIFQWITQTTICADVQIFHLKPIIPTSNSNSLHFRMISFRSVTMLSLLTVTLARDYGKIASARRMLPKTGSCHWCSRKCLIYRRSKIQIRAQIHIKQYHVTKIVQRNFQRKFGLKTVFELQWKIIYHIEQRDDY